MTVHPLFPTDDRFTNRKTAANLSSGPEYVPEAPMWSDENEPYVNSLCIKPPSVSEWQRRENRKDAWMGVACVLLMYALAYMAVTPDHVRVLPQEQSQ